VSLFFLWHVILKKLMQNAAKLSIENGAAGIIVSNHGARQLDYVPATISCLEEVRLPSNQSQPTICFSAKLFCVCLDQNFSACVFSFGYVFAVASAFSLVQTLVSLW
jgi:hypothetical protein